jgi:hypothetical protein
MLLLVPGCSTASPVQVQQAGCAHAQLLQRLTQLLLLLRCKYREECLERVSR